MIQPFVLSMAIQERECKGRYTEYHWRKQFKRYLKTTVGKIWYGNIRIKENKDYIKQMLKELK